MPFEEKKSQEKRSRGQLWEDLCVSPAEETAKDDSAVLRCPPQLVHNVP